MRKTKSNYRYAKRIIIWKNYSLFFFLILRIRIILLHIFIHYYFYLNRDNGLMDIGCMMNLNDLHLLNYSLLENDMG